jgi:hypothetical protein
MVHSDNSKRQKLKPRGRAFPRGNKFGKLESEVLDNTRHDTSSKGEVIENKIESVEDFEKKFNALSCQLIDSLEFENGKDKISIQFIKRGNNSFRIQIFLNDKNEIRPTTYNGSSMAFAYWNLLKGTLKNDGSKN